MLQVRFGARSIHCVVRRGRGGSKTGGEGMDCSMQSSAPSKLTWRECTTNHTAEQHTTRTTRYSMRKHNPLIHVPASRQPHCECSTTERVCECIVVVCTPPRCTPLHREPKNSCSVIFYGKLRNLRFFLHFSADPAAKRRTSTSRVCVGAVCALPITLQFRLNIDSCLASVTALLSTS